MDSISVVVPVYCAENSLHELYQRIVSTLDSYKFEIIFIEDQGGDASWNIICDIAKKDKRVIGFQHSKNYGQHNALLLGIRHANYEYIVTLDDDLQNPPEEIPKLMAKLQEGYDIVYGVPQEGQHGIFRNIASKITKYLLQKSTGITEVIDTSSFRAFRTFLREAFINFNNPFVSIDVLLSWGTAQYASIEVAHNKRVFGSSNYSFSILVRHAINMLISYSLLPLRLATIIGLLFTIFGILLFMIIISSYFIYGRIVQGFTFLASIIIIFSGAQLFSLGIFGEYLTRIYFRSLGKPYSVVRRSVGIKDQLNMDRTSNTSRN
ncbi:MAG: glycosyltransferase family 2 protein [Anaerolineales bacterium]|nr:glycosyltransferase family 2 protein [Anaerolineales bacterium]